MIINMIIFFNCYVRGEGYVLKRLSWDRPEEGQLEEVSLMDLPEPLQTFIKEGDTAIYLNITEGVQYGYVKGIDSYLLDENGRKCFYNVALMSSIENIEDAQAVRKLINFAHTQKSTFTAYMSRVVLYSSQEYTVEFRALNELITAAECVSEPSGSIKLHNSKWKDNGPNRNLFFYCSTPSMGFVLRRIDPTSGIAYRYGSKRGETVESALLHYANRILTHGGASMALFKENDRICFVVKNVKAEPDQIGRQKTLSLVIDTQLSDSLFIEQLAAYSLLAYPLFADEITSCVDVYDGPRGYSVRADALNTFLTRFDMRLNLSSSVSTSSKSLWDKITNESAISTFRLLVLESNLEYFNRVSEIAIQDEEVDCCLSEDEVEQFSNPLISFSDARSNISLETLFETANNIHEDKTETVVDVDASNNLDSIISRDINSDADRSVLHLETDVESSASESDLGRLSNLATDHYRLLSQTAESPEETGEDNSEIESINLLDYKWFLPTVIGVLLAIIALIIILIVLNGNT